MPRNANQSKSSNYSLDFDGSSDISISGISVAGEFTLSAWVKGITSSTFYIFGSTNTSNWFRIQGGNAVNLKVGNGQLNDSSPNTIPTFTFNSTDWYCIVATRDSSNNIQVYVNGSVDSNYTPRNTATPVNANFVPNFIGRNQASYTTGQIDAVSIYDYALSESQVTTLWGGGTEVSNPMALPSTPITYYPLGGSSGAFRTPVNVIDQWLIENNTIGDYVFDFNPNNVHGHINLGASTLTSTTYSLSLWFNSTSTSTQVITEKQAGTPWPYRIYLYGTGNLELLGTQTSGTVYNDGKWHNVVIVQDPSLSTNKSKGYVDGILVTSNNSSGGVSSSNNFYIGGRNGTQFPYNGELSNFQLFSTALSGSEVETLYNYGSPIQTLSDIPQNSDLELWYKLDASEIYNSSSTEWSVDNNQNPSAYPSSLDFSGTSQYISCSSSSVFQNTSNFSVSFWVNMDDYSGGGCFLMAQGGGSSIFHIYAYGGNTIQVRLRKNGLGNGIISNINLNNKWNNICLVYDGTQTGNSNMLKFYLNKLEQTISFNSDIQSSINISSNFLIGQQSGQSGVYTIDGKLSNVSLFSNSLTDGTGGTVNQIETLYNNGTPLADMSSFSSLVSWWKLDNTTTGIEDSKGTNNGTNNGATEYAGFVNTLAGESTGMSQSNLVQSDLQTVAPYSKYALSF